MCIGKLGGIEHIPWPNVEKGVVFVKARGVGENVNCMTHFRKKKECINEK